MRHASGQGNRVSPEEIVFFGRNIIAIMVSNIAVQPLRGWGNVRRVPGGFTAGYSC
jgi:hypothetical protein